MIGENGTPETPDWTPCVGNTCAGCNWTANDCRRLTHLMKWPPCCDSCQHQVAAGPSVDVAYYGD